MGKPKILFVTYGGGHVNTVLPVATDLNSAYTVMMLALTTAKLKCKKSGLITKTFADYMDETAKKVGEPLAALYHKDGMGFEYEDSVAYFGCSFRDLATQYGAKKATQLFNSLGRKAFLPVNTLSIILDSEAIDLVVTTNSPRAEQAALIAAKNKGIPSIMLVDFFGTPNREEDQLSMLTHLELPTYIMVMHEEVKKRFISYGVCANKIFVTGQPAFDNILEELCEERIAYSSNSKVVLFACQPTEHNSDILYQLARVCQVNGYTLIVKLHPSQRKTDILVPNDHNIRVIAGQENVRNYIKLSDVVVTEFSTVGLEAVYLRKPLVTVDLSQGEISPYVECGLSYHNESLDTIESTIKAALRKGPTKMSYSWDLESSATDKVARFIQDIL